MNAAARAARSTSSLVVALLTMPFWMAAIGGYTELATRIVVMGLAAMSLNFLLGFTGVLSFGHAAYFGLGAYGAAMAIKYLGARARCPRIAARRRCRRRSPRR